MHLKTELEQRWFLYQYSDEAVFDLYDQGGQTLYIGVDPTADSLHLGNMAALMHAVNYMKKGNKLIVIVGWATGMVGDPGGKETERVFLDEVTLQHNMSAITNQLQSFFDHLTSLSAQNFQFQVINNQDFYENMSYIHFLRDIGKYMTVNQMISKESVKKRIEDPDKSISYTEFSYMLMQAFDFLCLYQQYSCKLQLGASDQRGNIITGVELIRKKLDQTAYAVTCPLILDATGKKFGKSEGNAIRLDPKQSPPFEVYQYFLNTADENVERFLKLFTLLDFPTIEKIVSDHDRDRSERIGQKNLAQYVLTIIFGTKASKQAEHITKILFGSDPLPLIQSLDSDDIQALNQATGGTTIAPWTHKVIDLCTHCGLTTSNADAKNLIQSWSLYLNEKQVSDPSHQATPSDLINSLLLLRKWKKTFKTILFT